VDYEPSLREEQRLTNFARHRELKVHPTSTVKADDVLSKHAGTLLVPPLGAERAKQMPAFISKDIRIEGKLLSSPS
jgi:hypothetical protein